MLYFLVHDAAFFRDRLTPVLAESWRQRDFGPIAALALELAHNFDAFAERFRLTVAEQPLVRRAGELTFDRRIWRHLAGELLFYAAADVPEVPTSPEALERLLGPDEAIRQLHFGSRDLAFGPALYRPGCAGLNDLADVARLAAFAVNVDPTEWSADNLGGDEAVDELDELREWFPKLRALYVDAAAAGRVIVCEQV